MSKRSSEKNKWYGSDTIKKIIKEGMALLQPALDTIRDEKIKDFTRICLENAPAYFWEIPAARGKTHHPEWTRCEPLGVVKHTAFACYFIPGLAETFNLNLLEYDCAMSAELLHDVCKRGLNVLDDKYSNFHPYLPRERFQKYAKHLPKCTDVGINDYDIICVDHYDLIMGAIERHMGSMRGEAWASIPDMTPETDLQTVVHLADMVSSRPELYYKPFMNGLTDIK